MFVFCSTMPPHPPPPQIASPDVCAHATTDIKARASQNFKEHKDALRVFRNGQLHFQESPDKLLQFFTSKPNRVEWAERLHKSIGEFFSEYRILCATEYLLSGRDTEFVGWVERSETHKS
jgi:hypothetical protein